MCRRLSAPPMPSNMTGPQQKTQMKTCCRGEHAVSVLAASEHRIWLQIKKYCLCSGSTWWWSHRGNAFTISPSFIAPHYASRRWLALQMTFWHLHRSSKSHKAGGSLVTVQVLGGSYNTMALIHQYNAHLEFTMDFSLHKCAVKMLSVIYRVIRRCRDPGPRALHSSPWSGPWWLHSVPNWPFLHVYSLGSAECAYRGTTGAGSNANSPFVLAPLNGEVMDVTGPLKQ